MLHVDVRGNPSGQPLVLIHGFLSSSDQWSLNVERLGERLRLIIVELLGHGRSPAPDDPAAYGRDQVAGYLEAIRRDLGYERWWVCGQSLGGATGMRYALQCPDRVEGLIFTNSRAVFGESRAPAEEIDELLGEPPDVRNLPFHPINARRFPADVKERLVAAADGVPIHAVRHILSHRPSWRSADELGDLTMPVLLVNGRYERVFQPFVDTIRTDVPDLTIVHLDGGHSINVEQADAFNDAVLDFIDRRTN